VRRARSAREAFRLHRTDIIVAAAIAVATSLLTLSAASQIDPAAFARRNFDIYLQGDLPRTYIEMITRFSNGGRSGVHPLYPMVVHPPTAIVHALFGVSWLDAVRAVVALFATVWALCLFVCGRLLGIRTVDAVLVAAVGLAGCAARFWLVVPETFAIGGVALLIAVAVAARSDAHDVREASYVAAGVATFGSTLTNWSTGIILALTSGSVGRAVRISLQVAGATALLWIVEKLFFPNVVFIFDPVGVRQYVHALDVSRILDVTRVFFSHAAVAPVLEACRNVSYPQTPFLLTFQGSGIFSAGPVGAAATIVWLAMLVAGVYALIRSTGHQKARIVLGGSLAFQYGLHLLYGGETFLYSIHWWGLLVVLVAVGLRTKADWAVRLLAIVFVFTAGSHNWRSWESSLPAFHNGVVDYPLNNRICDF
jgi:hypothetical protein